MLQRVTVEHSSNLGRTEGQPKVPGFGFRHGIHCQSARIASGQFESRNIKTHGKKGRERKKPLVRSLARLRRRL